MTSRTSYNSLGKNVRAELHKMRSAILLLMVLYLAAGPVWFVMQLTNLTHASNLPLLTNFFIAYFTPFYFLALAVGTLGGFYATRYQQVPAQVNFYHSLPVTRPGLLSARVLSVVLVQGVLMLFVTVVDVAAAIVMTKDISWALSLNLVGAAGVHYAYIMLVFLLALAVSLFGGQLTANAVGQTLMTAVLHLSVPLTGVTLSTIISVFSETVGQIGLLDIFTRFNILTGFKGSVTSATDHLKALNPALVSAEEAANFAPHLLAWPLLTTLVYIVLTVLLFLGAYVLYTRRPVEKAGDTLIYTVSGSIIKALYVFLVGLVCGLLFNEMIGGGMAGFIIGAVIAAIVVHLICEMLYSMDVDGVRRHFPSTVLGLLLALLASLGLQAGVVDFDQHLPGASSVKGAVMAYSGEGEQMLNVRASGAEDAATIEKVMAAAKVAQEKNVVIDWSQEVPEDTPETVGVNLSYRTLFGTSERSFVLTEADAEAIMQPLLDDENANRAAWASLADAQPEDIVEMHVLPAFSDVLGGNELALVESQGNYVTRSYDSGFSPSRLKEEEGAEMATALLEAVQADIAARDRNVLATRVVATIDYSVLTENNYGEQDISWSNRFNIYEGDQHAVALLDEWRENGVLEDERSMLEEKLAGTEAICYNPGDVKTPQANEEGAETFNYDEEAKAHATRTLSAEEFAALYLEGGLLTDSQARISGETVRGDLVIGLLDGRASDDGSAIIYTLYLREGTVIPEQSETSE